MCLHRSVIGAKLTVEGRFSAMNVSPVDCGDNGEIPTYHMDKFSEEAKQPYYPFECSGGAQSASEGAKSSPKKSDRETFLGRVDAGGVLLYETCEDPCTAELPSRSMMVYRLRRDYLYILRRNCRLSISAMETRMVKRAPSRLASIRLQHHQPCRYLARGKGRSDICQPVVEDVACRQTRMGWPGACRC